MTAGAFIYSANFAVFSYLPLGDLMLLFRLKEKETLCGLVYF
jgi:hypothetical protein